MPPKRKTTTTTTRRGRLDSDDAAAERKARRQIIRTAPRRKEYRNGRIFTVIELPTAQRQPEIVRTHAMNMAHFEVRSSTAGEDVSIRD